MQKGGGASLPDASGQGAMWVSSVCKLAAIPYSGLPAPGSGFRQPSRHHRNLSHPPPFITLIQQSPFGMSSPRWEVWTKFT